MSHMLAQRNADYEKRMQALTTRPAIKIIGLTGTMGAGKTTAANMLYGTYQMDMYAFATPLKKIAEAFGFEHHELYGTQAQKEAINPVWNVSARKFMQTIGTEVFRQAVPEIMPELRNPWIRIMENKIKKCIVKNEMICIDDVRFADEADLIRALGGRIIRIERPLLALNRAQDINALADQIAAHLNEAVHASETADFTADYTITNSGSADDLFAQLGAVMAAMGHPRRERLITKSGM